MHLGDAFIRRILGHALGPVVQKAKSGFELSGFGNPMFSYPGSGNPFFKDKLDWIKMIQMHTISDCQIWISSALRSL